MANRLGEDKRRTTTFRRGSAATASLRRVDLSAICFFAALAAAVLFSASCGRGSKNSSTANSTSGSASKPLPTPVDPKKAEELQNKKPALLKASFPIKLDPNAMIKGKYLVVGGEVRIGRGLPYERQAKTLEDLETLIQAVCSRGSFIGTYEKGVRAYARVCKVSLIDYRAGVIVAQKTFTNSERENLIAESDTEKGVYLNDTPDGEILRWLNGFKIDRLLPGMSKIDETEMIRLPTTVQLNPNPTLKGKAFIAKSYEEGEIDASGSSIRYAFDSEGIAPGNFAFKPEELETLVTVICTKGTVIGKTEDVTQYSNRCEVSLIDYKTLTVFAQQTFENTTPNTSRGTYLSTSFIVDLPRQEILKYLKSLPTS